NNPALAGIDVGNTGTGAMAIMMATPSMLVYASESSDGTPHLFAVDKQTGRELARVQVPATSRYGMMSYVHHGEQYIILQTVAHLTAMSISGPITSWAADRHVTASAAIWAAKSTSKSRAGGVTVRCVFFN